MMKEGTDVTGTRKKYKPGQLVTINHNVAVGSPKPPKGNRITDGTQNSSIGEKQSYTSK